MVFWTVSIAALAGLTGAGPAHAQFPTPCNYTLSPPEVVPGPAGALVAARLTPAGCLGAFRPYLSVACIQLQGEGAQCAQARGNEVAQVTTPYRPGATYISSGRGLGTFFNDMSEPNWQVLGPISATL
jgi:hypothetical protein